MLVLGVDGTIEFASPSCMPILGYAPEELVGRNCMDLVHPQDAPQWPGKSLRRW